MADGPENLVLQEARAGAEAIRRLNHGLTELHRMLGEVVTLFEASLELEDVSEVPDPAALLSLAEKKGYIAGLKDAYNLFNFVDNEP